MSEAPQRQVAKAFQPGKRRSEPLLLRLLKPSLADCLFVALLFILFASGAQGWSSLLADGDTGWHIRTGQWILSNHAVPTHDLFSFSKPQGQWFAWEWLADLVFAWFFGVGGLKAVVLISAFLICLASVVLLRYTIWRGANLAAAVLVILVFTDSARVHYLARPHLFTLLLLPICLWILDKDRRHSHWTVWLLVPLTAIWTNLHGGFLALIACLLIECACTAVRDFHDRHDRSWSQTRRYAILTGLCGAATLLNPYGLRLHQHLYEYLGSDWIVQAVDEFQSPQFRSESMTRFEILLFCGLIFIPVFLWKRRYEDGSLILFWAHQALKSVRHVPLFGVVATPAIGEEISQLWEKWSGAKPANSTLGTLHSLFRDLTRHARTTSLWVPAVFFILWNTIPAGDWPKDFPVQQFPVALVNRNIDRFKTDRLFTTDSWGGFLIYHVFPKGRVFMDGRSDFYGPDIAKDYIKAMDVRAGWREVLDKYEFRLALTPRDRALCEVLKTDPHWRVIDQDKLAVLFERSL